MSRGTATGLPVARPIVQELPAIYQDHAFLDGFTAGLDTVLAPAVSVIDCLHAYIDPANTPDDFLGWLGEWVGLRLEEDWSTPRRRRLVAEAAEMFAVRGTVAALGREIELYTDGVAHIDDPGSTNTSAVPGASYHSVEHDSDRTVRVVVDVERGDDVNWNGLQALIRNAIPAHLPVDIELRETGEPADAAEADAAPSDDQPPDQPSETDASP